MAARGRPLRTADPDPESAVWRALADPSRRRLLDLLRSHPQTTHDLAREFAISRFAVMQHLDVLQDAGLVVAERRGRERWNSLNPVPLREAYERWMAPHAEGPARSVLRLREAAEQAPTKQRSDPMAPITELMPAAGRLDVTAELVVDAEREHVFDTLLRVGDWWPHRFRSGSSVVLDPQPGGAFREDFGNGNGAVYGTVAFVERPEKFSISGPMGMSGAVSAVWTMTLTALDDDEGRTRVTLTHRGYGDIDEETAQSYTLGWQEVLETLARAAC
jgi:DNA-binding transcriptional ArsR family regulator